MPSPLSSLESALYLAITAALAPGIVAHEFSHYAACRLFDVRVHDATLLNPFAETAGLDHERVDSFPADLGIALAPLVVNTPLAVAAFVAATAAPSPVAPACWWVGATFAFTAFPSHVDTETLLRTAGDLPRPARPAGYVLAVPVRAATALSWLPGVYGALWVWVCLGVALSTGVPAA